MKNNLEFKNKPHSIIEEEAFKEVIETRKISPEDYNIIEKLSSFPKQLFIEMHNFFSFSKNNTLRDLQIDRKKYQEELEKGESSNSAAHIELLKSRIAFLDAFIEFAEKYDSYACNQLNRAFENRKI